MKRKYSLKLLTILAAQAVAGVVLAVLVFAAINILAGG